MKRVFLLTVSLSIISMVLLTKWWYMADSDTFYTAHGFPMMYNTPCLHTSLCTQYFVKPLLINLFAHLAFWCLIVILAKRYVSLKAWGNRVVFTIYSLGIALAFFTGLYQLVTESIFIWEPSLQWEVVDSRMETIFNCEGSYHEQ